MADQGRVQLPREQVLAYLKRHPEGASEAQLERALGVHGAAIQRACLGLEREGLIYRDTSGRPARYRLSAGGAVPGATPLTRQAFSPAGQKVARELPWYVKPKVQVRAAQYLAERGWSITRVGENASRETGRDIEAGRLDAVLWVAVRGYPVDVEQARAGAQAAQWFKDAIFDAVQWRQESRVVHLALAFPDMPVYRALAERTLWLAKAGKFSYLWVGEQGAAAQQP